MILNKSLLKIDFVMIFWQTILVLNSQKKRGKFKKTTSGAYIPVLMVLKWTRKFCKRNTILYIVPRTLGYPQSHL
jgi:hypothetical protein